jgi:hypothetical protein
MNDFRTRTIESAFAERYLNPVLSLGLFTAMSALGLYGYLGTFSRYGSDDYCLSAFFLQNDLIGAMVERYFVSSSRYTNILFIGLVDKVLGWYNVAILPAVMLALFALGLYLLLKEIRDMTGWTWSRWMILLLAAWLVFFSVLQSPDLYETLYWRAGMTSHFAPMVFIPFFGAFLLRQIRKEKSQAPSLGVQAACFVIPFLIGGLSEPPTALMITVLALAFFAAWRWSDTRRRRSILIILGWALLGAITALAVMALAPANSLRMQTPPPPLPELIWRVIYYPSFFIRDTLRTLPIPTIVSVVLPGLFFYVKYSQSPQPVSIETHKRLVVLMILVLLLTYLLIAASFAPSVYGQSFPAPRARFAGRVLMTAALMAEGAMLGTLLASAAAAFSQRAYLRMAALIALAVLMLYPLRSAQRMFPEIPFYQQRAAAWDARETEIRTLKEQGAQDLVVRFLSKEVTQDLGDRTGFRLNRCAAALYGVNSIIAVPMDK